MSLPLDPGECAFTPEGRELLEVLRFRFKEDLYTPEQIKAMTIEQEQEDNDNPVR